MYRSAPFKGMVSHDFMINHMVVAKRCRLHTNAFIHTPFRLSDFKHLYLPWRVESLKA